MLVGRDDELRALTDAVDAAAAGHGSLTILVGDPGVGKSRLASEAASYAADRGFRILTGHAVESATPVPLRPLAEAVVAVARSGEIPDAPELAEYWPALGLLAPEWNRGGDSAELSPLILGEAVLRLLGLVSDGGTMLVLEELQWADPETLAVLEYLADNVADRRVACVATVRQSEPSPALELIGALHARRVAEVIEVRRLAEPDIATMAAACLDQDPVPGDVLTRLLANCDGLPFAVEEI
ncbi:MAG: ATP-binding protein, partial [Actinomycetota bacterium]|nr:ATP-binding protein [Actinomycetota bacterium]